jgi:hypothetical protein
LAAIMPCPRALARRSRLVPDAGRAGVGVLMFHPVRGDPARVDVAGLVLGRPRGEVPMV